MKMKGTTCQKLEERIDFRKIKPGKKLKRNGGIEVITRVNYETELKKVYTAKRNGEAIIIELGYYIDPNTKKLKEFFAGIHHERDTDHLPYKASKDYSGLNEILREAGL